MPYFHYFTKKIPPVFIRIFNLLLAGFVVLAVCRAQNLPGNPEDNLPSYIRRITNFGERADFSHDGSRVLFVEKTLFMKSIWLPARSI